MGLGGDDDEAKSVDGVTIDAVELVRPLLKIREEQSQKMMQDMMMKQMQSSMGSDKDGGGEKAIARSVEMLEQLVDSGAVGPEELDSLKQMMESQMGMPVDELLARRGGVVAERFGRSAGLPPAPVRPPGGSQGGQAAPPHPPPSAASTASWRLAAAPVPRASGLPRVEDAFF